jgi:NAD(P)H-dependent flavin oxidoreductase YrpB (nitropropane dioxygenase family)
MIRTKLTDMLGIKHPIIQAGMGPFSNNHLAAAAANAGVLGLHSTSGIGFGAAGGIHEHFVKTAGADMADDHPTILRKLFRQTYKATKDSGGVWGLNVMVSGADHKKADMIIETAIKACEEEPELKNHFKVIFTSAGDPVGWGDKIKGAGFKWFHVIPSVKGAERCAKAGVDLIVASGHEGGFHTSWEPIHSMVLLPAVVEALEGSGIPIVGAGGFCDGKTLAAALAIGAEGIQMGTRFLATAESDFARVWKEGVVKAGDRQTLVARGFVGPARWIKTAVSLNHQKNTLEKAPGVYLGDPKLVKSPEDAMELIKDEVKGINAAYAGDEANALIAGGECAQRIHDLPTCKDLVEKVMADAEGILAGLSAKYLV